MSASFNKIILIGNLTRDPETRYTPKGTAVASFGLAVNRKWRDEVSGETKEECAFIDVAAFGKQAETLAQYLKKGAPLFVEGRLRQETWQDKQTGQNRHKLSVVLESFQFLGTAPGTARTAQSGTAAAPAAGGAPDDDGPPF